MKIAWTMVPHTVQHEMSSPDKEGRPGLSQPLMPGQSASWAVIRGGWLLSCLARRCVCVPDRASVSLCGLMLAQAASRMGHAWHISCLGAEHQPAQRRLHGAEETVHGIHRCI